MRGREDEMGRAPSTDSGVGGRDERSLVILKVVPSLCSFTNMRAFLVLVSTLTSPRLASLSNLPCAYPLRRPIKKGPRKLTVVQRNRVIENAVVYAHIEHR